MISVAMATYNGKRYIKKQLLSILNQTRTVDEIIICDDCSTDESEKVIRSINDPRIKYYRNNCNLGYINNFYKAISMTSGDYIFLADQDDIWKDNKVELLMSLMMHENCDVACSNFELIDYSDQPIEDRSQFQMNPFLKKVKVRVSILSTWKLAFGNVVQGCTYCFTKNVKDVYIRLMNEEVIHDYQIILIGSCIGKVCFLNEPLIQYRIHTNNSVGFKKSIRKIYLSKKISNEPFMVRFFKELNEIVPVKKFKVYITLYYFRIPFICAIVRRLIFAE